MVLMGEEDAVVAPGGRPPGLSSRVRRLPGCRPVDIGGGVAIDLPVTVDLLFVDPDSGELQWSVEAIVDRDDDLVIRSLTVWARGGLDVVRLQREFRWATPLDIVGRLVPRLIADGQDPFGVDLPVTGYPEAGGIPHDATGALTDAFLESIAREYLALGRGYADELADRFLVSRRTVVSWVEKARRRGILTPVRPGQFGGEIVPAAGRRPPRHRT